MANLPKGTTLNNHPIVVESTKNQHRHNASSITGLNEDVQSGGQIYAEYIDGISYQQMQGRFVSENYNVMTGLLSVQVGNNTNNIISKGIVDNILSSSGVQDYELSVLPPLTEYSSNDAIVMVGESASIDVSWLPGASVGAASNISITGVPLSVQSDNAYEFTITNYDSFRSYTATTNIGTVDIDDGIVLYSTPDLSRSTQNVVITIDKDGITKDIAMTLTEDAPLELYIMQDDAYVELPPLLVIDTPDDIQLRINSYKSGYNYTVSGDLLNHGFTYTINADIITLHPPATLIDTTTSLIISDGYDTVIINIDVQNPGYHSWIVSTLGGSGLDRYRSVVQSNDGGYVAVGYQASQGQGNSDALIVKYDSNLNVIKQAGFGRSLPDIYWSVIQSNDGGYVAAGYQESQGRGGTDALIVKYDSNLNVINRAALGGSNSDIYYSITQNNDGGYVAVGCQGSQGQGGFDALIVKYDSNLNVIKQAGLGGSNNEIYYSITQSNDGGFIAVGSQSSQGQGNNDALIVKYNWNLDVVKRAGLGGSNSDIYRSAVQSNDGGYVVVGFQTPQGQYNTDALIVKYSSNLNVIKQAGLGGSGSDIYESVIQSNDGGYVVVGNQSSQSQGSNDALIVKYDSNLNVIKQAGLGSSSTDQYDLVIQSNDGGYVAVGYHTGQGQGSYDALITKLPSDLVMEGVISNHSGLVWTVPTLTETTPTLVATTPTLTVTTPTLTATTPTLLVETTPTLVETRSEKI